VCTCADAALRSCAGPGGAAGGGAERLRARGGAARDARVHRDAGPQAEPHALAQQRVRLCSVPPCGSSPAHAARCAASSTCSS
jgi:hypothetical protein